MDRKILDRYNIYCEKCGKYLFTEIDSSNVFDFNRKITRENDNKDYVWIEVPRKFLCNECYNRKDTIE